MRCRVLVLELAISYSFKSWNLGIGFNAETPPPHIFRVSEHAALYWLVVAAVILACLIRRSMIARVEHILVAKAPNQA